MCLCRITAEVSPHSTPVSFLTPKLLPPLRTVLPPVSSPPLQDCLLTLLLCSCCWVPAVHDTAAGDRPGEAGPPGTGIKVLRVSVSGPAIEEKLPAPACAWQIAAGTSTASSLSGCWERAKSPTLRSAPHVRHLLLLVWHQSVTYRTFTYYQISKHVSQAVWWYIDNKPQSIFIFLQL